MYELLMHHCLFEIMVYSNVMYLRVHHDGDVIFTEKVLPYGTPHPLLRNQSNTAAKATKNRYDTKSTDSKSTETFDGSWKECSNRRVWIVFCRLSRQFKPVN